jgi:hypothetical protein
MGNSYLGKLKGLPCFIITGMESSIELRKNPLLKKGLPHGGQKSKILKDLLIILKK